MPQAITASGLTLEYDTFGSPTDPPVLLVMGFTAQMIAWNDAFCKGIADGGRFVIRFDNRDCGLSSKLDGQMVDMMAIMGAVATRQPDLLVGKVPYLLSDMSHDAFAVLDALGIERAHIVGASMGGMIVQTMAIEHPDRVLSLTSIMSTTGEPEYGRSSPEAQTALLTPPPSDRAGVIAAAPRSLAFASKRYGDAERAKEFAALSFDRCFYPEGAARQLGAIFASGSRAEGLRSVCAPTLVIHGADDTLISPDGGRRTAELIPDATLLMVDDMGHDLPEQLWPDITAALLTHTA